MCKRKNVLCDIFDGAYRLKRYTLFQCFTLYCPSRIFFLTQPIFCVRFPRSRGLWRRERPLPLSHRYEVTLIVSWRHYELIVHRVIYYEVNTVLIRIQWIRCSNDGLCDVTPSRPLTMSVSGHHEVAVRSSTSARPSSTRSPERIPALRIRHMTSLSHVSLPFVPHCLLHSDATPLFVPCDPRDTV